MELDSASEKLCFSFCSMSICECACLFGVVCLFLFDSYFSFVVLILHFSFCHWFFVHVFLCD